MKLQFSQIAAPALLGAELESYQKITNQVIFAVGIIALLTSVLPIVFEMLSIAQNVNRRISGMKERKSGANMAAVQLYTV